MIGILDWELSTIGHPLSDLCNLTMPWVVAREGVEYLSDESEEERKKRREGRDEFLEGRTPGLPSKDVAVKWYCEAVGKTGWVGSKERLDTMLGFGEAFTLFRVSLPLQVAL